jgi:hypothetical protein
MAIWIFYMFFCVLVWSLWIKKLFSSSNTDTQTQRFAVEYQQIISHPEVTSTGSPKQRPVVETKVSDMMEVVTGSSAAFIRKVDERNEAVLKTQELSSKLTKLEDQLTSSNLKLQELQNVHEEFGLLILCLKTPHRPSVNEEDESKLTSLTPSTTFKVIRLSFSWASKHSVKQ